MLKRYSIHKALRSRPLLPVLALCGFTALTDTAAASSAVAAYSLMTSGYIDVINTATNNVVATIPVGDGAFSLDIAPDGKHVYVTNAYRDNLATIDTASNTVVSAIPVGDGAFALAVTPDGKTVYVTSLHDSDISVVDTASNSVVDRIWFMRSNKPVAIAVSPDGKELYVANSNTDSGSVTVIDTANNTILDKIDLGRQLHPFGIVFTPDGKYAYVADAASNNGEGTVSVIDTATRHLSQVIMDRSTASPSAVDITPDGKFVYVADAQSNSVSVIDTASNSIVDHLAVPVVPTALAITPDGKYLFVINSKHKDTPSGGIAVFDTATNTLVDRLSEDGPLWLAFTPKPIALPETNSFRYFQSFQAALTDVDLTPPGSFRMQASFTLDSSSDGIDPLTQPVELYTGPFARTIPAGSFVAGDGGSYSFAGVLDGALVHAEIAPAPDAVTGSGFQFSATVRMPRLTGVNAVSNIGLTIGNDSGTYNPCLNTTC